MSKKKNGIEVLKKMKMKKRICSLFFVFCLLTGLFMQNSYVLAMNTEKVKHENELVNYEVIQQYDDTTNKVDILLKIKESEEIKISKVKLPDGTECTENLSGISYTVDKNGIYDFTLYYDTADASTEKVIQEEVTQIVSDTQDVKETIHDEAKMKKSLMAQTDNIYTVNDYESFKNAVDDIKSNGNDTDEYIISLNNDITFEESSLEFHKKIVILGNGHTLKLDESLNSGLKLRVEGSLSLGKQGEIEKSKLTISGIKGKIQDRALFTVGSTLNDRGVLNIYDGVTIKNSDCNGSSLGSAIAVYGTLNMYGGEITENSIESIAHVAGAVGVEEGGTFNMYGGKIHNNLSGTGSSRAYGGGVLVNSSTFNMYGGEISNNKSVEEGKSLYGGGVALIKNGNIPSKAIFGKDAVIKENIGTQGGGLYIQGDTQVTMEAGFQLINNQAMWGGGLFHEGNKPIEIQSGVIIANNIASNSAADIYISGQGVITLSDASNMNQKFNGSNRDITGWYYDYNPRWEFMDADKVDITRPVSGRTGIIAAYEGLPKYRVAYEFVSGTDGKDLPQEITDLLPIDSKEYEEGSTIKAIQPKKTTIKVADGTWTFKGYDTDEKEATSNVKFTGTWVFNPKASIINTIPIINAEDKTLTVGDTFDPMKDVTAIDKEDGDLTNKIEILKNEVDTSKAGVYEVTYKVTDSKGASTVKTIKVTVKAKDNPNKPNKPDEPEKPDKPNKPDNPETGDQTNLGLYASMLVTSSLLLTVVFILRRKKRLIK